jgi:Fe-S-cluster containining protein
MPGTTNVALIHSLPLTCTRTGACCHGKMVWLNPWELARMAVAKGLASRVFRDRHCEFGGIRLRFDGLPGWKGLATCSQYLSECGCSVHVGRPLSCRLYPLGRQRRGKELHYLYQGSGFPCLVGCPEVVDLPYQTVANYLTSQDTMTSEASQDEYLELMQRLADGAFALLIESGLAASGDRLTLRLWRKLGNEPPELLAKRLGQEWIDRLMLPDISDGLESPAAFVRRHHDMLQSQAQTDFGNLGEVVALRQASGLMMGLALHLGRGLGANPAELAEHWIVTAKKLGARE